MSLFLEIKSVKFVKASVFRSNWKGMLQIIDTQEGMFLDNDIEETYQMRNQIILGYNWSKEVGKTLYNGKDYIVKIHDGLPWLKRI